PVLLLRPSHHDAAQHLLRQAHAARRHRCDPQHRGGGSARRVEARGVLVEAAARLRRLRGMRALPCRAPRIPVGAGTEPDAKPWCLPAGERLAWAQGLDVPVLEEGMDVEYLYWVGCSASYDRRNQAIARAVVKILKAAGVSFAVLAEERCHAEVARRLGEEYLYQTVAQENIE